MTQTAPSAFVFSSEDSTALLSLARQALLRCIHNETLPVLSTPSASLACPGAAFVSLYKAGSLRGCIGSFSWAQPLWESVARMTCQAATRDPRFAPVQPEEVGSLSIELSLLSRPSAITGPEAICIGRDGLIIEEPGNGRRGVLLPQVATKYGWSPEQFLEQTCIKALLPPDAWKQEDVLLYAFGATVLQES
jgi:AmmeMemoRadiSam system protein A